MKEKEIVESLKDLELTVRELEYQLENFEDIHENHLEDNDVRALVDKILTEKEYVTKKEMDKNIYESQLQLTKWIVGTGISVTTLVVGILRFF
ncbi:hypothetical protein [Metabacillus litoralis]|uniref:hypothetical protein n=1 Tax=Metabacillus litoralis TaxID=152268 RepID=UPI001CFDFD2A|nr:hypothetical protein [Metabacillus litoralis]